MRDLNVGRLIPLGCSTFTCFSLMLGCSGEAGDADDDSAKEDLSTEARIEEFCRSVLVCQTYTGLELESLVTDCKETYAEYLAEYTEYYGAACGDAVLDHLDCIGEAYAAAGVCGEDGIDYDEDCYQEYLAYDEACNS